MAGGKEGMGRKGKTTPSSSSVPTATKGKHKKEEAKEEEERRDKVNECTAPSKVWLSKSPSD